MISGVSSPIYSGSASARAYSRTHTWQGIQQNILGKMVPGQTYQISGWVRLENASSDIVKVTVQKTDGSNSGNPTYVNVETVTANDTGWIQLSGNYTLNVTDTLTELNVYFEGPASGISFFVDDANVYGPVPPPITTTCQIDTDIRKQTIEGLGGAIAFYNNWFTSHPYKQEIFDDAFAGLNLSMLRLGNGWRGVDGQDTTTYEVVAAAKAIGRIIFTKKTLFSGQNEHWAGIIILAGRLIRAWGIPCRL